MKRSFLAAFAVASTAFAQGDLDAGAVKAEPPIVKAEPVLQGAAEFSARLDAHWVTRDAAESIKQQNQAVADGLKAFPSDYDLLWRSARHKWFVADGQDADHGAQKKALAKEAWAYADRALKVKPGAFEGHYYKALSIGAYSEAIGVLTALSEGIEGQFVENLDIALKTNEAFDRAGPVRAKGRYYASLPWPKRDREKAVELLNKAIKLSPEATRSYLYLAEVLLQAGKVKEAQAAMRKVYSLKQDFDPPEGRRVMNWARPIAAQIEAELK
jgi:tetratricopeptide (TPR) repeat protein